MGYLQLLYGCALGVHEPLLLAGLIQNRSPSLLGEAVLSSFEATRIEVQRFPVWVKRLSSVGPLEELG